MKLWTIYSNGRRFHAYSKAEAKAIHGMVGGYLDINDYEIA